MQPLRSRIDGRRSSPRAQAEAPCWPGVLRAFRLPGRHARGRRGPRDRREGAVGPDPRPARRRASQAPGQGLRLRARAALRDLAAHAVAPPEEAARGRHRRRRAARPVGLLLRTPRRTEGALGMAELTGCCSTEAQASCCEPEAKDACCGTAAAGGTCGCAEGGADIRDTVRQKYAAAARAASGTTGAVTLTEADERGVFGASL